MAVLHDKCSVDKQVIANRLQDGRTNTKKPNTKPLPILKACYLSTHSKHCGHSITNKEYATHKLAQC